MTTRRATAAGVRPGGRATDGVADAAQVEGMTRRRGKAALAKPAYRRKGLHARGVAVNVEENVAENAVMNGLVSVVETAVARKKMRNV